jgi:tRNA U34 5-carboxymethylaminomethyl modifying enzyme MnmG/GidA
VDGRSLDYSMNEEKEMLPDKFSIQMWLPLVHQRSCHMTYTSLVHDILREGFDRSPMFNGRIKSLGPRYCPSIEDKLIVLLTRKDIIICGARRMEYVWGLCNGFNRSRKIFNLKP